MESNLDPYLIELESKIQILERENETLSAKAEENLLLNRAFEEINVYDDIDSLLLNTLESISVLLNIQFSGLFDLIDKKFVCKSSYALFSSEDTVDIQFELSESVLNRIVSQEVCFLNKSAENFIFNYPNTDFEAIHALILPVESEIIKSRYFVFINDITGQELEGRLPLFEKIIRIISAKLERIFYQNELKKLNEELEKKVELRTFELFEQNNEYASLNEEYKKINEELWIAKEKAEESDRLKTAFLQNMSHEIRTPMNAIMGFSSLLVDYQDNKPKLIQFSEIINQRCSDLLDIINDILDISKIESGQLTINSEDCDIFDLFSELNSFFSEHQLRIGKQHIKFSLDCLWDQSCLVFQTDKVKLKQILINLIGNAFKFTENGSIDCGCKQVGNELIFHVSDTGIGIPEDKHELIFERFTQLRQLENYNIGGTGLGLSIAKALTGLLGGKIWLESKPNEGTTFYFSIHSNKWQIVQNEIKVTENIQDFNYSSKTILIVEDDIYNARYLKEILTNKGFNVVIAEYGKKAIQIISSQIVDLVLMDIRLPDMNGYEATYFMKQAKPQLKIIAQTAYAAQEEKQKALDAGCIDYISKPTKRDLLLALISKHLAVNANY